MPIYESTKRAKKKWEAENYEAIGLRVHKGEREKIKAFAESRGESLNAFVTGLIFREMGEASEPDEQSD